MDPKNRLNDLDSREWLQFQKSWVLCDALPVASFLAFFSKKTYPDGHQGTALIYPPKLKQSLLKNAPPSRKLALPNELPDGDKIDYAYVDLTEPAAHSQRTGFAENLNRLLEKIIKSLRKDHYLTLVLKNHRTSTGTFPVAWETAKWLGQFMAMKDEKIGCLPHPTDSIAQPANGCWSPDDSIVYFMNFRKEKEPALFNEELPIFGGPQNPAKPAKQPDLPGMDFRESWFIHKPPPRARNVLLHPAKFPENLVQQFVKNFSRPGEWVLDPMAGTGSSLVAATASGRKACGIELNPEFAEIAQSRFLLFDKTILVVGDARQPETHARFPEQIDYCITSPPYWDMLRMKGAQTQARRKAAGLPRWYSDDPRDLGNVADYRAFLDLLTDVYKLVALRLRPGRYLTIIVKNVKKKGMIYPLAWDIVERLQAFLEFSGEQIWCQDDQRLAPFGYRYAWVSNTFHHYCLTFRKPR